MKTIASLTLGLSLALSLPAQAELTLSGSPSSTDRTELNKRYEELAKQLSQELGEPVRYVAPINFEGYAQALRKKEYDLLIDGPHLSAWRIGKGIHKPVVAAKVSLQFLVVVPANDASIQSPEQLIAKPVCVQYTPHLSTLMFLNQFPNPMQQPTLRMSDGYNSKVEKLLAGECRAAVLTASFYETGLDKPTQAKLRIIYDTPPLPGYIFTASDKLSEAKRQALAKHLTNAAPATDPLLQALNSAGVRDGAPDKIHWVAANPAALKGMEEVLINHSYGWE